MVTASALSGLGGGEFSIPTALSALVHRYSNVFSGRTEYRWSFDRLRTGPLRLGSAQASRRRENTAPPQDERIRQRTYEMLRVATVSRVLSIFLFPYSLMAEIHKVFDMALDKHSMFIVDLLPETHCVLVRNQECRELIA